MPDNTSEKVEVKYCELCGALWVRQQSNTENYCPRCAPAMQEVARGRKKPPQSCKAGVISGGAVCA